MKTLLKTIIICLYLTLSYGQTNKQVENLKASLKNAQEDSTKVDALHDLWRYYLSNNPEKSEDYAKEIIEFSRKINYENGIARGYLYLGIVSSRQSDFETSKKKLDSAYEIFKRKNNKKGVAITTINLATDYFNQSKYDSSLYYNKIAENYFASAKDSLKLGSVYILNSAVYLEKGFLELSLQNGIKSAEIFKKYEDYLGYAKATYNNACVYESIENKKGALKSYYEAIPILKENNILYTLALAHQGLGILYTKEPIQVDSATVNIDKAIEIGKQLNDSVLISTGLNKLGKLQLEIKNYDKAKSIYAESILISESIHSDFSKQTALLDLGELYLETNQLNLAEKYTLEGLGLNKKIEVTIGINRAYENLYKIYKKSNKFEKALKYHEKFMTLNDSIYGVNKVNKISELHSIYETEKKEAEIALQQEEIKTLNQEAEISNLTKSLYAGGMFTFITVSGLLFFGFKQRMKKNRIAREKQEEIYKQEIAFKKKELTSQTLHLVQKNTFIQELKENLERIKQSPELFKIEFRRLVMLLKKQSAEDKDWEVFKSYFSEVHNNFDNKIKSIASDISEKEIRLASFLRMNLSTKEIASMLNVLPESVLKSKYRLKKKLQLDKDTDLNTFLNTL
tara:strand:- start:648 stop:2525 length:1878 start_codon:yes stop_codon:yes gene_type:complete